MTLDKQFSFTTKSVPDLVYLATYDETRDLYVIRWNKHPPLHKEPGHTIFGVKVAERAVKHKVWILKSSSNEAALCLLEDD